MSEEKNNSEEKAESQASTSNDSSNDSPDDMLTEKANENILPGAKAASQKLVIEQSQTSNIAHQTSDIQNMEVHHHPNKHHSKKWKDYVYEFLMLFLAVTAGFFVENRREYYIEHQRANQFSRQLLADLRLDSVMFENWNSRIHNMQKGYDSLLYLLTQKNDATDREILETLHPLVFVFDVPATTTTYNQMKSSGSLRYIENQDVTAHLQHYYDVLLPRSVKIAEASLGYFSEHITPFYLKHVRIQDYDPFNDTLTTTHPAILEHTTKTNQELANIMGTYRSLLKIQLTSMNDPALQRIKETIVLLKEEYDLE